METNALVVDTQPGSSSYTVTLSAGKPYRWNVAACNSSGCSSFTTPRYFQTPGSVPSTPTNLSPGSTSSPGPALSSRTVTLDWSSSSGATHYDLGVRDMETDALVVDTQPGSSSYTVTLSAGKPYRWNVAACNSSGCSSFTSPLYFRTPGSAPSIISVSPDPVNGSNSSQPFTIFGSNFVSTPNVTLRDHRTGEVFSNRSISSFSSSQITIHPVFTTVAAMWSVEVINPDGHSSGPFSFAVQAPAQTPSISSVNPDPATGSNNSQPFTIFGSNFVSTPNVTLRDHRTGEVFSNRSISSFSSSQITINPVFTTVAATWSVEIINPGGQSSGTFSFEVQAPTTLPPPPNPIDPGGLSSPGSDLTTTTPTFSWTSVSAATGYGFYISRLEGSSWNLIFDSEAYFGGPIQVTSLILPTGILQEGGQYRWNANSINSAGWGEFSSKLYFSVSGDSIPARPTLTSPGTPVAPGPAIETEAPVFVWQPAENAESYGLYVSRREGNDWHLIFDSEIHASPLGGTSFAIPPGYLIFGGEYRWNLRALNAAGWGSFSPRLYFTVGEPLRPPIPVRPGSPSLSGSVEDSLTPLLEWQSHALASNSRVGEQLQASALSESFEVVLEVLSDSFWSVLERVSTFATSHAVPSGLLEPGKKYRWRIKAHRGTDESPYSENLCFQIPPAEGTLPRVATSFRMPIAEDIGLDLSLLDTDGSPYPIFFNQDDSTEAWYVFAAFNQNRDRDGACYDSDEVTPNCITHHPGEDWNALGRSDLNLPVRAIAHGYVAYAGCTFNFGNTVAVIHRLPAGLVASLYGHLNSIEADVTKGKTVDIGHLLGRIGGTSGIDDGNGGCAVVTPPGAPPHLHFEIRRSSLIDETDLTLLDANRFSTDPTFIDQNYLEPSQWLQDLFSDDFESGDDSKWSN